MVQEEVDRYDIPGYEGYQVDEGGRVYGQNGQELAVQTKRGIPVIALRKGGKTTSVSVQRLVCLAFHGEPQPGQVALRVGPNRTDVYVDAVRWGYRTEMMRHDG